MDGDVNQRGGFEPKALVDFVHNETLPLLEHLSVAGRWAFLAWSFAVGTHFTPGVASAIRNVVRKKGLMNSAHRFVVTQYGRYLGLRTWVNTSQSPRRQLVGRPRHADASKSVI
jgi:hypothetical protein